MSIKVRADRPFGLKAGAPSHHLNLEGESEVQVDKSIQLHASMAKRWAKQVEAMTGIRIGKRTGAFQGSPFTRDELAKRVEAGKDNGWQESNSGDNPAEKELGGQYFPETEKEMGEFAEKIGLDFDGVKKALAARGARLLMPGTADVDPEGIARGARTAMNNSTNSAALAVDYLAQFQFQISGAGQLEEECFGQHVDLPNGKATLDIKRLGYGQMYLQGPVTTESYTVVPAVEPTTDNKVFAPFKLMMSMWATGEFDEDCFAPWLPAMEQAARLGRGICLDHIILRGHAEAGAGLNINAFGGVLALGANDPRSAVNGIYGANWDGTIGGGAADSMKGLAMAGAQANLNMVPTMRAALNKYGLQVQTPNLRLIGGARTRAQFKQDVKARLDYAMLVEKRGNDLYLDDVKYVELADSVVTNASAGGMPTYALWNSEGNPINLNAAGCYDAVTTNQTALALMNRANWIFVSKRMFNWLVVRLPLADQVAVVGSERLTFGPVHDSVSEVVASALAI